MGLSSGPLGALLGLSWALLGPSWGPQGPLLGLSWAILEAIDQKRGRRLFQSHPRGPKNRLLGPSWGALGALLGALGAVLGLSWASLGAVMGHLGAIWRPQEPIESENVTKQKHRKTIRDLNEPRLLGNSLGVLLGRSGGSQAVSRASWPVLKRSWAV